MNRIAKIDLKPDRLTADIIDAKGEEIGTLDVWANGERDDDLIAEIASRWPGLPAPSETMFRRDDSGVTRSGARYRILAIDLLGDEPIAVAIYGGDEVAYVATRPANGRYNSDYALDLTPPRRPVRVSDATVEAARTAWFGSAITPPSGVNFATYGEDMRKVLEAAIARHLAEQGDRK